MRNSATCASSIHQSCRRNSFFSGVAIAHGEFIKICIIRSRVIIPEDSYMMTAASAALPLPATLQPPTDPPIIPYSVTLLIQVVHLSGVTATRHADKPFQVSNCYFRGKHFHFSS